MKHRYLKNFTGQKLIVIFMVICSSLINGTAIGQTSYYVNDNSTTDDVYTSAVGASGNAGTSSAPFATVTAAIAAATAGDVIYVDAGSYTEQFTITKPITLNGPNAGIAGNGSRVAEAIFQFPTINTNGSTLITVSSNFSGVTISGFDLRCQDATIPQYHYLIRSSKIDNLTIRNNRLYGSEIAMYILTSGAQNDYRTGMLIEGNYVDCGPNVNNSYNRGIYVQGTSGIIQDNQFLNTNNAIQYMPYSHSTSSVIRRNTVTASQFGLYHNYQNKGSAPVTWEQNVVSAAPNPQTGLSMQVDGARTTPATFSGIHVITFGTEGTGTNPSVTFQNNSVNAANPGGTTTTVFRAVYLSATSAGTVTLSNNSFTNYTEGIVRNTDATATTIAATCNWWGSSATANVTTAASSATSFNPWLNSGSDVNAAIGFQPDNTTCTGGTPISLNESHVNIVCSGGTTGSINLTVSGGTSPFSYAWTKSGDVSYSASTEDLSNLASGTYTVVVTDANNATATTSIEITSGNVSVQVAVSVDGTNALPATAGGGTTTICANSAYAMTLLAINQGSGPMTFVYNVRQNNISGTILQSNVSTGPISAGGTIYSAAAGTLSAGTYFIETLSITDAQGCQVQPVIMSAGYYNHTLVVRPAVQVAISVDGINPLPATAGGGTTTICSNSAYAMTLLAINQGSGPMTFVYNVRQNNISGTILQNNVSSGPISVGGTIYSAAAGTLSAGTYFIETLSITDAQGCKVQPVIMSAGYYNHTLVVRPAVQVAVSVDGTNPLPATPGGGTTTICANSAYAMTLLAINQGSGPMTFVYNVRQNNISGTILQSSVSSGAISAGGTIYSAAAGSLPAGTYFIETLSITDNQGCQVQPVIMSAGYYNHTLVVRPAVEITTQPSKVARKVALNIPAVPYTITAAASSSLTYQWYSNTTASNSGGVLIAGATSNSYTPPTSTAYTAYFYCVVSNENSCSRASDVSEVFTVCN